MSLTIFCLNFYLARGVYFVEVKVPKDFLVEVAADKIKSDGEDAARRELEEKYRKLRPDMDKEVLKSKVDNILERAKRKLSG